MTKVNAKRGQSMFSQSLLSECLSPGAICGGLVTNIFSLNANWNNAYIGEQRDNVI
jgi:hypothetical protein